MQNPYAAPGTGHVPFAFVAPSDYVPLGWRTTLAGLVIALNPVFSFGVDLLQLLSGKNGDEEETNALVALAEGASGLGLILALVAAPSSSASGFTAPSETSAGSAARGWSTRRGAPWPPSSSPS